MCRPGAGCLSLYLSSTQITDAGCAALAAALDSGALPVLETLYLVGTPASAAATAAVCRRHWQGGKVEGRSAPLTLSPDF